MLQNKKWVLGILLLPFTLLSNYQCVAQSNDYSHPMNEIFEKGLFALKSGDTNKAYANIESAYTFSPKNDDVAYHYIALSLSLDKSFAEKLAHKFIVQSNNRIYISRLQFLLGKYYFNKHNDVQSLTAFSAVSIDDLDNKEITQMKYEQGYLHFKAGNWDNATGLLNTVRQVKDNPFYEDANYYAGFIALEKKEFKEALNYFKIASTNKAYAKLTPFYISQLYYFIGDIDAAMENCEIALASQDQYYQVQLKQLMGHLLFEKKQFQKALPYLAGFVEQQKKVDPQDLYQLSFCYFQSQNWLKAIDGFKELANVEDSLGQNSMYLLATSYLKVNDKVGAKNAFLICSTKSQNSEQKEISLFNYAKLAAELKEYSVAVTALDKFMSVYPKSANYGEAKGVWVASLTLSNNYVQALEAYASINQPSIDLLKLYPNMLLGKAAIDINDGHIEQAYHLLSKILNTPYNSKVLPQAQFWLGELLYKMGRVDESIIQFERFLLDPVELPEVNQRHARYSLGYCYLKKGIYPKAQENFSIVSKYNHSNMIEAYQKDAFLRMADCQLMQKQYKIAMQSYQKIIDLGWDYTDYATLQKAIITGGLGQKQDKIKILLAFDTQFPNSLYANDAYMELADTYTNYENYQDAIAPLNKVLINKQASSYYPQAYYKLGIVYFNLNKNQLALENFKDLISTYPNSTESENAFEFVRNIFIEDQTPELFVQFMNDHGKPLSYNEQDSLTYRASMIKYDQKKYGETMQGLSKYLLQFPSGKNQLEANNIVAEIAYAQQLYDSSAVYFAKVADQSPNKFAERAALVAARLNYFNLKKYDLAEKYFSILNNIATQQENKVEALKGLLRCYYNLAHWEDCSKIATLILQDKTAAIDDLLMSNMALYHNSVSKGDTTGAMQFLNKVIKTNPSALSAEAHYLLAKLYLDQGNLASAEKTSFDVIKKQAAYEYWVTKTYILLGDIYVAQKDNFNAIATYKSVAENASIEDLKTEAANKLKMLVDHSNIK
jgi:tetratricopeptide (TPR) repeat protein